MSAWSIIKRPNEGGRCSHLLIQIPLREGGASSPLSAEAGGEFGARSLEPDSPLGRAWEATQARGIRIGPGGKNETQMGKTLPQ